MARQPFPHLAEKGVRRGGFWTGAVAGAHAAAYFAVFQQSLPEDLRTPMVSLAHGILTLCHLVVPMLGGSLCSTQVSSSTPGVAR